MTRLLTITVSAFSMYLTPVVLFTTIIHVLSTGSYITKIKNVLINECLASMVVQCRLLGN